MNIALQALNDIDYKTDGYISVAGLLKTIDDCFSPETTMDSHLLDYFKKCVARQVRIESPAPGSIDGDPIAIPKEQLYFAALASLFNDDKASESNKPDESTPEQLKVMDEMGAINNSGTAKPDAEMLAEICRSNMEDTQITIGYCRGLVDAYRQMYEFLTGENQNEY